MQSDVKIFLAKVQEECLQKMVDCETRQGRVEALERYREATTALGSITLTGGDTRYSVSKNVIDAVLQYLTDLDHPAPRAEIIEEVTMRGFPPAAQAKARGDITKSLKMHLDGQAKVKGRLKEINSLVGLPAWPDARFERGVENVQPARTY